MQAGKKRPSRCVHRIDEIYLSFCLLFCLDRKEYMTAGLGMGRSANQRFQHDLVH